MLSEDLSPQDQGIETCKIERSADERVILITAKVRGLNAYIASYIDPDTMVHDMNVPWSMGCAGNCASVCSSGEKDSLSAGGIFTADEIVGFTELAYKARGAGFLKQGYTHVWGAFADGDASQEGTDNIALQMPKRLLHHPTVPVDRVLLSTTIARSRFLDNLIGLMKVRPDFREKVRLHYSLWSADQQKRNSLAPSRKIESVMPQLAECADVTGYPVTLNVPVIADITNSDLDGLINLVYRYGEDRFICKLSTFHPETGTSIQAAPLGDVQSNFGYLNGPVITKIFVADECTDSNDHKLHVGCGELVFGKQKEVSPLVQLEVPKQMP